MAKTRSKTAKKTALTRATEKRVREIAKSVEKTGRLYSPASKKYVKPTARSIKSKALILGKRDLEKAGKEVTRDARQINKTTKEAIKLIKLIFSEPKKKQAKKTPARKTPPKKSPPPKPPRKTTPSKSLRSARIYDLEDLPEAFNNATFNGTLEELEENAAFYNSLLKSGDVFGARIGYQDGRGFHGGYTHSTYTHFELFVQDLHRYRFARDYGDDEKSADDLKSIIKIIRFKAPGIKSPTTRESAIAWRRKKEAETAARKDKFERHKAKAKAKEAKKNAELVALRKERKQLRKRNEELELEARITRKKNQIRGGKKK